MAQASGTSYAQGRLGIYQGSPDDDLIFSLNPSQITRTRNAVYADAQVAHADYSGNYPQDAPPPIEWLRNQAEEISFELLLYSIGKADVETELAKLDNMMAKSSRTGEPPDLIFEWGRRRDRVRMQVKEVREEIYKADLKCQQARVHIKLKAIRTRTSG